ncbi:MAG: TlpA disulfide reductase family protein [Bacteroides sp.]|nr:TlpA disulfide reductase family protein [Bacteroides sp.]
MPTLKERVTKWKETRTTFQKIGDVFFWFFLILLIIPGPRKVISTTINRVALSIKTPSMIPEDKQLSLGEEDYNWVLISHEGEKVDFSQFKGKPVFLNFWATWCPPCVAELPEIQKAWEKHGSSVDFLLVTNQDAGVVQAFMEKYGYTVPVHYAASPEPGVFQHSSIPTTYILSPDGKIVVNKKGAVNWDSKGTDRVFDYILR